MKLQAGTLMYALAISLVIGMITASVLINEQYTRMLIHRDVLREEVVRNAESGINYLCADNAEAVTIDKEVDLFGRGKDSVHAERKPWGMFDVLIATAHSGNEIFQRIAIAGQKHDPESAYALWLGDMDRALKVCGQTELKGKCFLPKAGIERTYIEGSGYSGRQLVYGLTSTSARFIPECNKERAAVLASMLKGVNDDEDSLVSWEELSASDTVFCSFAGPCCLVDEKSPVNISGMYIEGQVCIRSSRSITVHNTATLVNVLLVAPEIKVEDKTQGTFQIIARDSVVIGKNVELGFPSSVSLCCDKLSPLKCGIVIGPESTIGGTLFAVRAEDEMLQRQMLTSIDKGCIITGDVYTDDALQLKGSVFGSVTCQKIVLTTNSASYENILLDAVIDNTNEIAPPGGCALQGTKRKEVISWLR